VHGAGRDPLQPRRLEGLVLGAAGTGGEATSAGGSEAGGCDRDAPEPTAGQAPGPSALRAQVAGSADHDGAPTPAPGASPAEAPAAIAAEREALRRLSRRVAIRGVQSFAASVAAMWQVDPERFVPRVLYATLRNLERFRATPSFAIDATLRTFVVREPVPGPRDPVAELRDPGVLYDLLQRTVEAVLDLGARAVAPPIERSASLDYLQRLARAVAVDPRASSSHTPASGGPSVGELRAELRDVERYRLPEWEKALRRAELHERL
jgi:hypothetical protein